jgi:hypothetical protein
MRRTAIIAVAAGLLAAPVVSTHTTPPTTFVDCEATEQGNGSLRSPFNTITRGLSVARAQGGSQRVIEVLAGVCDDEALPLVIDFPLVLTGQGAGTIVTTQNPVGVAGYFDITDDNVTLTRLTIDGLVPLQPDVNITPPMTSPVAIRVLGARDYELSYLQVRGVAQALRSERSSGRVAHSSFVSNLGLFFSGGPSTAPANVVLSHNEIGYRVNGIAMTGSGGEGGEHLIATITNNEIVTLFTDTGDTNPAAFRVSPAISAGQHVPGFVDLVMTDNNIVGPARFGILVHGGMPTFDGKAYTGDIDAVFSDNAIDSRVVQRSRVTFTHARVARFPCEVSLTFPDCEGKPKPVWDYLKHARFTLQHDNELTGPKVIDHPEFQPSTGDVLGNQLIINNRVVPYRTFMGQVSPSASLLVNPRATRALRGLR